MLMYIMSSTEKNSNNSMIKFEYFGFHRMMHNTVKTKHDIISYLAINYHNYLKMYLIFNIIIY